MCVFTNLFERLPTSYFVPAELKKKCTVLEDQEQEKRGIAAVRFIVVIKIHKLYHMKGKK